MRWNVFRRRTLSATKPKVISMSQLQATSVSLAFCALLSACSHGGGSNERSNQFCHTIDPAGFGCTGCVNTANEGEAFDQNLETFASMAPSGQAGLEADAAHTQVGGSVPGVYLVMPSTGSLSISVTTLLHGTQQETAGPSTQAAGSQNCAVSMECEVHGDGEMFFGLQTTKDYDAIQVTITNSGAQTADIHEICVQ